MTKKKTGAVSKSVATLESFGSFAAALKAEANQRANAPVKLKIDEAKFDMVIEFLAVGGTLPVHAMREAIGTGAWDSIMLDALHKRLAKGWGAVMEDLHWSKVVSMTKNVTDFKNQYAVQVGDLTVLDKVPEKGDYHNTEFSDDRAEYAVEKYGNIFGVSYESAINDDLNALGSIVQKFGGAAARTVEKFIFGTLIGGTDNIYDGSALFVAAAGLAASGRGQYNDLGTGHALSEANVELALTQMRSFTDIDGNALDMKGKYLLVNPAQEWEALRLMNSTLIPGSGNNDVNVLKGRLEIIVTSQVVAGTWYVVADPGASETIEIGFLGGKQAPEIFEEESNSGHSFKYDEKRYKARIVFGGCVTDWRGFVKASA